MKYPYLKIVHEEVIDGGLSMALVDMAWFAVKVFVFVFVGYTAVFAFANVWASRLQSLTPDCAQQVISKTSS